MRTNLFFATFVTVMLAAGCDGGDGESGGSTTTPMMTTTTTPMTTTGDVPTTTEPGETGETGDDTTGGGPGVTVNGCDSATATDMTGMADVTITQTGLMYEPKCVKISAGTNVKFVSSFASHPLVGGVVDGTKMPDPASPITATSTGMEATFAIATAGNYGYYCDLHALSGMVGAIFAE